MRGLSYKSRAGCYPALLLLDSPFNPRALKIDRLKISPTLCPANMYLARLNSYQHTPLRSLIRLTTTSEEPVDAGLGVLEIFMAGQSTEVFISKHSRYTQLNAVLTETLRFINVIII
jgi:hypothetical protein